MRGGGVMDWQDYDYVVASQPHACVYADLCDDIENRTIIAPVKRFLVLEDQNALYLKMAGVVGLVATPENHVYIFKGNRHLFDLAIKHHPSIDCWWIDQFKATFADPEAKLLLDTHLGDRVLRAKLIVRPTV